MFKLIEISSPGKVILCGEHSVVYGKKALATSINLRTRLTAQLVANSQIFEIIFTDLNKDIVIDEQLFASIHEKFRNHSNKSEHETLQDIVSFLVAIRSKETNINKQFLAVELMILSLNLKWNDLCGFKVEVKSDLPLASGLGSSASFATCLSSFFLKVAEKLDQTNEKINFLSQSSLELINDYAFHIEMIFHGKPSGIDNSVSTFGNYILFEKGAISEQFTSQLNLDVLIVNSNIPKQTITQVEKVRNLYQKHTFVLENLMNGIDALVGEFCSVLKQNESSQYQNLNELITINQGMLYSLHITNTQLNMIINLAQKNGFSSKITGAGGGGCCYVLLHSIVDNYKAAYESLCEELEKNGFSYFKTQLGCQGIRIDSIEH
jgi:mevalonate kinase